MAQSRFAGREHFKASRHHVWGPAGFRCRCCRKHGGKTESRRRVNRIARRANRITTKNLLKSQ